MIAAAGAALMLLAANAARADDATAPAPATAPAAATTASDTSNATPATSLPPSALMFANRPGWSSVGVNIGNLVTGITAKLWASPKVAVQAALGGGSDGNDLRLHVDLIYSPVQWASPDGQYLLPLYFGLGGVAGHTFSSGATPAATDAGFRVPVGMSVLVRGNPIELFLEVAPELTITTPQPATGGRYTVAADGAIGFRYYL
jgi:hypothetical protein